MVEIGVELAQTVPLSGSLTAASAQAFAVSPVPSFILVRSAKIVCANRSAELMLALPGGLARDGAGRLAGIDAEETSLLRGMLKEVADRHQPVACAARNLILSCHPLCVDGFPTGPSPTILLTVLSMAQTMAHMIAAFARRHALTRSEERLVRFLAEGRSLAEIAAFLSVSRETLKCQLQAVFQKTDTHRQAQLLARLTGTLA